MNTGNPDSVAIALDEIASSAYAAAERNRPVTDCPFPDGSEKQRRWQIHFHARQKELREEIEA